MQFVLETFMDFLERLMIILALLYAVVMFVGVTAIRAAEKYDKKMGRL